MTLNKSPRSLARALVALLLGIVPLIGVAASAQGADSGSLTWGFKASWRSYVTGIAAGTISTSGGAATNSSGEYVFPQDSTDMSAPDGTGVTKYEGSVNWRSTAHGFSITMTDPWLEVRSSNQAVLTAVLTDDAGESRGRVDVATVELDDPEIDDDSLTWTNRPTVISDEAGESFGRYGGDAGDPLDAVVHAVGIGEAPDPEPTPTPTPTPEPTSSPTPDPTPRDAELIWGLKDSFRSYITGPIAKGRVNRSGGTEVRDGIYVWDQDSAAVDDAAQGSASYGGSIRFQGHEDAATSGKYALDLELKDPAIAVSSATSAVLSFRVVDRADGVTTDHGRIDFAKVSLSGATVCGSAGYRGWSGASTTITADGARIMNNYPEGTALDRLAFSVEDPDLTASGVSACTTDPDPGGGSNGGGSTPAPSSTTPPDDEVTSKTAGKLTWGVKESFRSYIVGSIAKGSVTVSDGAKTSGDLYQWGQESTATTNGVGTTDYFGSVRFTGHGGELDMDFSDPRVDVESTSSGSISFAIDGRRVELVDLDLAEGSRTTSGGVVRWSDVPATLTSDGADAFENRYDSGTVMDRVSFIIGSRASAGSDSEEVDSHDSSSSSTVTPTSLAAAVAEAEGGGKCPVTEANLSWGFKESFRSYISGSIAKGDWNVGDGASYATPNFGWTQASGTATAPTKAVVNFTGTVRFTGHNGALNTTIANPSLLIANDKATLKLDVSGASRDAAMEGTAENQDFPDIAFATIDLSGIERDGTTWTANSAPTTLTSSGHAAFDSYEAGTALDPVTFSVTFEDCLDEAGKTGGGPAALARQAVTNKMAGFEFEPWMASMLAAAAGTGIALGGDRLVRKVRSRR